MSTYNASPSYFKVNSAMGVLQRRVIPGVGFDSKARVPPPRCHPETRIDLLENMSSWRDAVERVRNIFWVIGPTGSGKSAIAQTFAEDCDRKKQLAGSFFSRPFEHDDVNRVIPTLAYQLANRNSSYEKFLAQLLAVDPSVTEGSLSVQFKALIEHPIRELRSRGLIDLDSPLVIVLDGLDRYRDSVAQVELLRVIDDHIRSHGHTSPFLWAIFSRPERYLKEAIEKLRGDDRTSCQLVELDINDSLSVKDVERVLKTRLDQVSNQYGFGEWPTEGQLQRILQAASGFFLYASDVLDFIGDPARADPATQLKIYLDFLDNPRPSRGPRIFKSLDNLYWQVLSGVHIYDLPVALDILRFCTSDAKWPWTTRLIQATLNITPFTFYSILQNLHSVLYIPPPERADLEHLRVYHLSFSEFLRDRVRSAQFTLEPDVKSTPQSEDERPSGASPTEVITEAGPTESTDSRTPAISEDNLHVEFELTLSNTLHTPTEEEKLEVSTRLSSRLSHVLETPASRKALRNLKGERAQLIIDYLYSVLLEPSFLIPWLRKHSLIALYKLSKASLVYPHCYILKEIVFKSHEGGGTFSDVHRGQHGKQDLCLKVIRLHQRSDTEAMLKIYAKEAILWGQLRHANIVPFYGIYYLNEARKQVCLVSPWMRNGNLVDYLKNNPTVSRPPFIYDIVSGLEYLHSQNLIHSDIKGLNILVSDSGRACITDFGLSFIRTDQTFAYTTIAATAQGLSYRWAAPELLEEGARASLASDVWALGCVFYEVLTGLLPFHGLTDPQVFRKLMKGELPAQLDLISGLIVAEKVVWGLVDRCWEMEPGDRPTCQEILQELKKNGLQNERNEDTDGAMKERQDFLEAMRKNEDVLIDLARVEQILSEL